MLAPDLPFAATRGASGRGAAAEHRAKLPSDGALGSTWA
jgi:hypothetical protein